MGAGEDLVVICSAALILLAGFCRKIFSDLSSPMCETLHEGNSSRRTK